MKFITPILTIGYAAIALVFGFAAMYLVALAGVQLWHSAVAGGGTPLGERAALSIEAIGLVAVALMALEMSQTVVEEEIVRKAHVSVPTRARRYLSRFLVVVVVALSIESLVGVVRAIHLEPRTLPHAAAVTFGAAALLAAWGAFVRLNRTAEELEPEGIGEARREDAKLEG